MAHDLLHELQHIQAMLTGGPRQAGGIAAYPPPPLDAAAGALSWCVLVRRAH